MLLQHEREAEDYKRRLAEYERMRYKEAKAMTQRIIGIKGREEELKRSGVWRRETDPRFNGEHESLTTMDLDPILVIVQIDGLGSRCIRHSMNGKNERKKEKKK